jgi:ribosomal protein L37E
MPFGTTRARKEHIRTGYLFCPRCWQRTPGDLFLVKKVFYLLGLIPLMTVDESRTFVTCRRCGQTFEESGDWAFDFGDHAEPRTWECRTCGQQNTSERFRCSRCGKHV